MVIETFGLEYFCFVRIVYSVQHMTWLTHKAPDFAINSIFLEYRKITYLWILLSKINLMNFSNWHVNFPNKTLSQVPQS